MCSLGITHRLNAQPFFAPHKGFFLHLVFPGLHGIMDRVALIVDRVGGGRRIEPKTVSVKC